MRIVIDSIIYESDQSLKGNFCHDWSLRHRETVFRCDINHLMVGQSCVTESNKVPVIFLNAHHSGLNLIEIFKTTLNSLKITLRAFKPSLTQVAFIHNNNSSKNRNNSQLSVMASVFSFVGKFLSDHNALCFFVNSQCFFL